MVLVVLVVLMLCLTPGPGRTAEGRPVTPPWDQLTLTSTGPTMSATSTATPARSPAAWYSTRPTGGAGGTGGAPPPPSVLLRKTLRVTVPVAACRRAAVTTISHAPMDEING